MQAKPRHGGQCRRADRAVLAGDGAAAARGGDAKHDIVIARPPCAERQRVQVFNFQDCDNIFTEPAKLKQIAVLPSLSCAERTACAIFSIENVQGKRKRAGS